MCETCGCAVAGGQSGNAAHGPDHHPHHHHDHHHDHHHARREETGAAITVMRGLMAGNDHQAAHNRAHFAEHRVLAVNLMSSPGAGKTALLEATIAAIGDQARIAVIEGDLETENDAERIRARGVPAVQITTGTACHLDASMVHDALHGLDLDTLDVVFIENVGNLVCPAAFDLGQHANVALLSVTEGRRQAGEVSGDVPRRRSGAAQQDRPAGAFRRLRSRQGRALRPGRWPIAPRSSASRCGRKPASRRG